MPTFELSARHRLWAGAVLAAAALALIACSDGASNSTATDADLSTPGDAAGVLVLTITPDGFEPDAMEIREGDRLTVRNDTDDNLSIILQGTSDDTGPDDDESPREIEPRGLIQLPFTTLGAQILTVEGKPDLAATIMVVAGSVDR